MPWFVVFDYGQCAGSYVPSSPMHVRLVRSGQLTAKKNSLAPILMLLLD
jgi:hypothetical protein